MRSSGTESVQCKNRSSTSLPYYHAIDFAIALPVVNTVELLLLCRLNEDIPEPDSLLSRPLLPLLPRPINPVPELDDVVDMVDGDRPRV